MEKMLSASSLSRSSSGMLAWATWLVCALPFLGGCAYSRIAQSGERMGLPPRGKEAPLHVVDFLVETHDDAIHLGGARIQVRSIPGMGNTLEAEAPEWFATGPEAVPIIVKVRKDELKTAGAVTPGDPAFWTRLVGSLTLWTIPMYAPSDIRFGVFIQTGLGEWSDSAMVSGREELVVFNPASALLFSWFLPERTGWQSTLMDSSDLLSYVRKGSGANGINTGFASMLAERIVSAWNDLSPAERERVLSNPMAKRKKQELQPWVSEGADRTSIPVPGASEPAALSGPVLISSSYNAASRRGTVSFQRNDMEQLAALGWARETVLSPAAGKRNIRILREDSRENGVTTIEFEVVP